MTGLERLIAKVSNSTAMMGNRPAVATVEAWSLEELRRSALEDVDLETRRRQFEMDRRQYRRMVHFGCE